MSIIAAGTTTTTALSSTGNTDGTLQLQVNGTTPSVTLNTLGAVGVGASPSFGTSGQALLSAGSTAAPAWGNVQAPLVSGTNIRTINGSSVLGSGDLVVGGGALIFISSITASAASTVSFTTGINSTYDDYIVEVSNLGLGSTASLVFRISENNGSTYLTGNYFSNQNYLYAGTVGGQQKNADRGFVTNEVYQLNSTTSSHISFRLCNVNATSTRKQFVTSASLSSAGAAVRDLSNAAYTASSAAINAIQFFTDPSQTITGTFRLYGIKKS